MDTNTVDVNAVTSLLISGKYLVALGTVLVPAIAGLRALLGIWFPWFKSKIGGYVLAYATTYASSLALALSLGTHVDSNWLITTLGTALMTSGVLDHWRDLFSVVKKQPATVTTAAILIVGLSCSNCAGTAPTGGSVITTVVSCAATDGDLSKRIEEEALKMAAIAFGPDLDKWQKLEVMAINDGLTVGGCAFSKVVNDWLTKKSLVGSSAALETQQAKKTFENYRATYAGGATFHFKDLDL